MHTDLTVRATSVAPGHVRLQVRGELDLGSAPLLHGALARALPAATERLDLDLDGVDFLDAGGLGALVWCRQRALAAGAACQVVALSPAVERILLLTGTHDTLTCPAPAGRGLVEAVQPA